MPVRRIDKMKIIFCRGQFIGPISGAEEVVVAYATELKRIGQDPSVLLMYPHPAEAQYTSLLADAGVHVAHATRHPTHTALDAAKRLAWRLLPVSHFEQRLHRG